MTNIIKLSHALQCLLLLCITCPHTTHCFVSQAVSALHRTCLLQSEDLRHPERHASVADVLQERYQVQEQQATSAQANLVTLQAAYSDLKAKHDSSVAAQAAAEQRLTYSASDLKALQTEHATHQAMLAAVSAERDRMTQAGAAHVAELSQMQRELSTSQVQLENSKELHRQVQEKLTAHEAGLTQLQQLHYQTGKQHLQHISTFAQTVNRDSFCAFHLHCRPPSAGFPLMYSSATQQLWAVTQGKPCQILFELASRQ